MTTKKTKQELESLLKESFARVKAKFGYIPLKHVEFSDEVPTAAIDMGSFRIKVNQSFIEKISEQTPAENATEGVLDHEVGHYIFHPYSLQRVILEHVAMKDKEHGEIIRQFYDDVNDNLRVISSKGNDTNIPDVYKSIKPQSRVEKVLLKLYQDLTRRDFGMHEQLDANLEKAVSDLKEINFLNIKGESIEFVKEDDFRNKRDLLKFYNILLPLCKQDEKDGRPAKNILGPSPSVKEYTGKEIKKALKELIEKGIISQEDAKDFIGEQADKMKEDSSGNFPGGSFNDNPDMFADRFLYESLACRYNILLTKSPLESTDGRYPTRHEKFEVGDNINDLDPFNSYGGKVLPGLSNKWIKESVKYHGKKEKTPDLMIILDDSGSMPNPTIKISNAVLSSFVIATEYLNNHAKVGVARFSDRTTISDGFSNDRYAVLDELLKFKNGGDTFVDLRKISTLAAKNNVHDYILITDGAIKNRDEVISFLNSEADKGARAYVVQIGETNKPEYEGKVKIIHVGKSDDIGSIMLDDIHRK
jgi:hypothetical protein